MPPHRSRRRYKLITYLDLVYDFQDAALLNIVHSNSDKVLVFSEHWKENLAASLDIPAVAGNSSYDKIEVLHHGFDESVFKRLDKTECRRKLGLGEEDFIVLNSNRNSYRKALDISTVAFLHFLRVNCFNPRIKLFIHCPVFYPGGYDMLKTIRNSARALGIDTGTIERVLETNIIKLPGNTISDDLINVLYNACDVGINTCIGEGFGLCNLEQAVLGKPQLVSRVGALGDIFDERFTVPPRASYEVLHEGHGGTARVVDHVEFARRLKTIYDSYDEFKDLFDTTISQELKATYDWDTILSQLVGHFA